MIKNKYSKLVLVLTVLTSSLLFTVTSHAEKFSKHELSAISENNGRLFIYRGKSIFGAAMSPKLYVDGKLIGKCKRATIGYLDLPPGKYAASAGTILYSGADGATEFEIVGGQNTFVKVSMGAGAFAGKSNVEVADVDGTDKKIGKLKVVSYEFE